MLYYERRLKRQGFNLIIGVDEAGRGPLAGPVVAAAAALKVARFKNRIDDSKRLTPRAREKAFCEILKNACFGFGIVGEKTIDRINILEATRLAMKEAVAALLKKVDGCSRKRVHVIVDGKMDLDLGLACTDIVKGDAKSLTIASASILAKVMRDKIMLFYDRLYPQYGFRRHKGYSTSLHRRILKEQGPSQIHRQSFL